MLSKTFENIYKAKEKIILLFVLLNRLQDVAAEKLGNIKERSATGLQYAIAKHPKLELDINIMPSYIVIPFNGIYQK